MKNFCRCGQEVRHGWRNGVEGWWHQGDVGHEVKFGPETDFAAIEAALDEVRYREDGTPYTTREFDFTRMKKAAREAAIEAEEEGAEAAEPIPPPEVLATPIEKTDPRLPGGAKSIWNLAEKQGWRVYRASYSRGPRTHASLGTLLSISDYFILGVVLDDANQMAVGSWCDGKFEFAYYATINRKTRTIHPTKTNSQGLKLWIKGEVIS